MPHTRHIYKVETGHLVDGVGGLGPRLWPDVIAPMTVVALTRPALHVGFLLTTDFRDVLDDSGQVVDKIWVAVIRWQGTA
jgi:hypothetical protein